MKKPVSPFLSLCLCVHHSSQCHKVYRCAYIYIYMKVYVLSKRLEDRCRVAKQQFSHPHYYPLVVVVYLFFLLDGHTHTFMTNSARKTQSVSLTSFLLLFLLFYFSSLSPSIQRYSHYSLTHSLLLDSAFSPSSFFSFIFF